MDAHRFDALARALALGTTRRHVLGGLLGVGLGGGAARPPDAATAEKRRRRVRRNAFGAGYPVADDFRVHFRMELKPVLAVAQPESLIGAVRAGGEQDGVFRQVEGVVVPLHDMPYRPQRSHHRIVGTSRR